VWLWFEDESLAKTWQASPTGKRGAQPRYSDTAIQTVLVLKAVFGLTNRSVEGFVRSLWSRLGYELTSPDHTLITRRAKTLTVQIPRRQPPESLHGVIDSTGLKVYGEGEWKVRQHGKSKRRVWRKVHVGVDTESKEIVTALMSDSNIHDADVFSELMAQIDFPVEQVSADGAYDKRKVYDELAERGLRGAIPPQDGAAHWEAGHPRNATIEAITENGWRAWAEKADYGLRSLAENAMYRLKTLTGSHLSARLPETHTAEVYARMACLNIMTALGMPDSVRVASRIWLEAITTGNIIAFSYLYTNTISKACPTLPWILFSFTISSHSSVRPSNSFVFNFPVLLNSNT
jgi:hypothetical protein